jgi:alcohol dehydrogenase (cytochrome c)
MTIRSAVVGGSLLVSAIAFSVLPGAAQSPGRTAAAPSRPALFTEAQAAAGRTVYDTSCASCHGAALSGGSAPALIGPSFQSNWGRPRVTLDDLFFVLRTTMPPRASDTVTPQDHAAVFAYILKANGYPAGRTALSANPTDLRLYQLQAAAALAASAPAPREFVPGAPGASAASSGPSQTALAAAEQSTDWLMNAHDYRGTRYSPLDEISVANASRLSPVCMFQMGERDNFQTGPIVYNGTMYVTTMTSTIALDAATCRVKWRHAWKPQDDTVWERNRGVAIKDGRIVRGTPDGYLLALNAETGALLWARQVAKPTDGETFTMAPLLFEDLVLIGPAGSENNLQGWVGAFKLADGSPVWKFHTVPRPGEPGSETWDAQKDIPVGGGAVWTAFALDAETGDLHVAVTNPSPDLPVQLRRGSNLYTNSIVVLDAHTGKLRWHRQLVPNDSHDWDLTHVTPLFETAVNGTPRQLVATAGKDGVLRVLDRSSHDVLFETPVTTRENADRPVTTAPTRVCPGVLGGSEWSGPAFNPRTRMLYVPAVDWCTTYTAFSEVRHIAGKNYMGGTTNMDPPSRAQGWLTAVDASSGAVRWKYRSSRPMVAAVTTTAGNLVLSGELTGDLVVLNAESGDVLYRFNTGGPIGGGVVTYAAGGRQFIAVASGSPSNFWVDRNPGSPTIVVFGLPQQATR